MDGDVYLVVPLQSLSARKPWKSAHCPQGFTCMLRVERFTRNNTSKDVQDKLLMLTTMIKHIGPSCMVGE